MRDRETLPVVERVAMVRLTDGLLALAGEIQSEHRDRKSGVGLGFCVACREKWPCKPLRLAALLTDVSDQ